jgi:hypothetical protein
VKRIRDFVQYVKDDIRFVSALCAFLILLNVTIWVAVPHFVHAQSATSGLANCDQSSGRFVACGPVALGANAITLPASLTSALTNIIDTRGAREATLSFVCTQGAVTVNVQEYAEDRITPLALVSPLSAVAAAVNAQITFGSESNPSSNVGTLSSAALVRLPQSAVAFSFTNASATPGTCTARLFLAY